MIDQAVSDQLNLLSDSSESVITDRAALRTVTDRRRRIDRSCRSLRIREVRAEYVAAPNSAGERYLRLAIPPEVSKTIARQYDALSAKNRRKGAGAAVETRKAKGIEPAFLKKRGKNTP